MLDGSLVDPAASVRATLVVVVDDVEHSVLAPRGMRLLALRAPWLVRTRTAADPCGTLVLAVRERGAPELVVLVRVRRRDCRDESACLGCTCDASGFVAAAAAAGLAFAEHEPPVQAVEHTDWAAEQILPYLTEVPLEEASD